jgi:hypothetical protein
MPTGGLLAAGRRDVERNATYIVAANGIVAERPPFRHAGSCRIMGADLGALVAWFERARANPTAKL